MKLQDFLNWLDSYINFEKTQTKGIFWLDSMKFLCERLDNPQDKIPCIHVAGSKGKGSTCKMIACIIEKAGFKCGLYSSPHISDFRERIGNSTGFFSDEIYEKSADELYNCVTKIDKNELPQKRPLTWFELVTVFAFLCFKNAKVDYVVYETGLGGRLDSTNVVKPLVSVITAIELEHTQFLGDTVEKIGFEKAGIIKKEVPVVLGFQKYKNVEKVFFDCALKNHSKYIKVEDSVSFLNNDFKIANGFMNLSFKSEYFSHPIDTKLKLLGIVQAYNAMCASIAVKVAIPTISEDKIENGLQNAFLPGRFEIKNVRQEFKFLKGFIVDGAHTVNSIDFTIKTLKDLYKNQNVLFDLLFACAADKDIKDIVPLFKNDFKNITITKPGTVRESDILGLKNAFEENKIPFDCIEDCQKAIQNALYKSNKDSHVLLVTGSFYLLAEINRFLDNLK